MENVSRFNVLEGQFIIKNLVLISAGLLMGGTMQGGKVISDPKAAQPPKPHSRPKRSEGSTAGSGDNFTRSRDTR